MQRLTLSAPPPSDAASIARGPSDATASLPARRVGWQLGLLGVIAVHSSLGLLSIAGGIGSLTSGGLSEPQGLGFLQVLAPVFPLVMISLGLFFLITSVGLWQGRRWAWTAAIAFEVVHIVADIGFVLDRSFALDKFVGLIVILAILSYLTRPAVRAYFCSKESDA
jgi:hypothetical protein